VQVSWYGRKVLALRNEETTADYCLGYSVTDEGRESLTGQRSNQLNYVPTLFSPG
jgi:hypothetical protein